MAYSASKEDPLISSFSSSISSCKHARVTVIVYNGISTVIILCRAQLTHPFINQHRQWFSDVFLYSIKRQRRLIGNYVYTFRHLVRNCKRCFQALGPSIMHKAETKPSICCNTQKRMCLMSQYLHTVREVIKWLWEANLIYPVLFLLRDQGYSSHGLNESEMLWVQQAKTTIMHNTNPNMSHFTIVNDMYTAVYTIRYLHVQLNFCDIQPLKNVLIIDCCLRPSFLIPHQREVSLVLFGWSKLIQYILPHDTMSSGGFMLSVLSLSNFQSRYVR